MRVESNEPDDARGGGDGATTGDIEVLGASGTVVASSAGSVGNSSAEYTFGPELWSTCQLGLCLRAERQGDGRTYTVTVTVRNAAGQQLVSRSQITRVPRGGGLTGPPESCAGRVERPCR